MTYKSYYLQMKQRKAEPMDEPTFNLMMGINTDTSEPCFLSPKYTKLKAVEPSLKEHTKRVRLS